MHTVDFNSACSSRKRHEAAQSVHLYYCLLQCGVGKSASWELLLNAPTSDFVDLTSYWLLYHKIVSNFISYLLCSNYSRPQCMCVDIDGRQVIDRYRDTQTNVIFLSFQLDSV